MLLLPTGQRVSAALAWDVAALVGDAAQLRWDTYAVVSASAVTLVWDAHADPLQVTLSLVPGVADVGDAVILHIRILRRGVLSDPDDLAISVMRPDGSAPTAPIAQREGLGLWRALVPIDVPGTWQARVTSTSAQMAEEALIPVRTSAFV